MGRKVLPNTSEASCGPGPDDWSWPHWPHRGHEQGTEVDYADLLSAQEKWQHENDEEYVEHYYAQQAEKRKRHKANRRERLWAAEERIAMSANDYRIRKRHPIRDHGEHTHELKNAAIVIDKSSMDIEQKPQHSTVPQSLSSTMLSLASTLDALNTNDGKKRKWQEAFTGNASSASGFRPQTANQLHRIILEKPYFHANEYSAPDDGQPQEYIQKSFPQPRTFGYCRIVPRLDQRFRRGSATQVQPPYGIQLIQAFNEWKQSR